MDVIEDWLGWGLRLEKPMKIKTTFLIIGLCKSYFFFFFFLLFVTTVSWQHFLGELNVLFPQGAETSFETPVLIPTAKMCLRKYCIMSCFNPLSPFITFCLCFLFFVVVGDIYICGLWISCLNKQQFNICFFFFFHFIFWQRKK